ncbi:right-handed parallel beta-helix repeat-containing protein [bacterium]|nr:right-handed parallel beta-helix repeat-containing protein [bacterium]
MKYTNYVLLLSYLCLSIHHDCLAQSLETINYAIGSPTVVDYFVDPLAGNDGNAGTNQNQAFKTLTRAWNLIPINQTLSTGFRINLLPGVLTESELPNYLESRHGTYTAPIIIRALHGRGSVTLGGDLNVFDTRYLYLIDLIINPQPAGDALHFERCDHILIKNCELNGGEQIAHEALKVNQSQYIYIEDSSIHGAYDNAIDFVAVQYGHVLRNKIHNAQDWCIYAKGGSAYIRVEANEIYNCGTGGFTAGQGTGFEFMTSPWLHYEAYDIKVINNIIHDTQGAGLGVNGGYNILLAHNTLFRVGSRSHTIEVVFGGRSCDGNRSTCQAHLDSGGWGTATIDGGETYANIGNKNVLIYNNIIFNPADHPGAAEHFAIYGPRSALPGSNVPGPVSSDENLQIKGNLIYNLPGTASLGIGETSGCQPTNPSCNQSQLVSENTISTTIPEFINAMSGDFRPTLGSNLLEVATFLIPNFPGGDRVAAPLAPEGNLMNHFTRDLSLATRSLPGTPGAYESGNSELVPPGGQDDPPFLDLAPVISRAKCSPKILRRNRTILCEVHVSDDHGIARVTITTPRSTYRLKRSGSIYKTKIRLRKKGKYNFTARVVDSGGNQSQRSIGRITVK